MDEQKKTYYIDVGTGEISRSAESSTGSFRIFATDQEITELRELFDQNYSVNWENFSRAHIPYIPYHYDQENDAYDQTLTEVYELLYQLGDEEAKYHIKGMNILEPE